MKKKYRELCEKEPTIPLFSKDWWLDSVAGSDNWDVALIETGGKIVASMPYVIKKKYGLTFLIQPPLSQTLGPWIRETDAKLANQLSREKDLMQALIEHFPVNPAALRVARELSQDVMKDSIPVSAVLDRMPVPDMKALLQRVAEGHGSRVMSLLKKLTYPPVETPTRPRSYH